MGRRNQQYGSRKIERRTAHTKQMSAEEVREGETICRYEVRWKGWQRRQSCTTE